MVAHLCFVIFFSRWLGPFSVSLTIVLLLVFQHISYRKNSPLCLTLTPCHCILLYTYDCPPLFFYFFGLTLTPSPSASPPSSFSSSFS